MTVQDTAARKARKSADQRLDRHQSEMQVAYREDVKEGPGMRQRHQWRVVTGWLMSEAKAASDANRQAMLDHLVKCAQDMNEWSRPGE